MTSVLPYDPHPYLHEGMQVEVIRGPLQGVHGILLRKEKRHRLVLGVRLIQQAAVVEIDVGDVVAIYSNGKFSPVKREGKLCPRRQMSPSYYFMKS